MHSSSTGLILEPWQNWAFLWLKGAVAATSTMTTAPVKMIWRDCCHPDLDAVISAHPAYCLPISTWTQNRKVPSRALCQCRYHRPSTSKAKAQQNNSLHIQIVPFHAPLCSGGGGDGWCLIDHYHISRVHSGIPVYKKLELKVIVLVTKDCWCLLGGSLHRHCWGLVWCSQPARPLSQPATTEETRD